MEGWEDDIDDDIDWEEVERSALEARSCSGLCHSTVSMQPAPVSAVEAAACSKAAMPRPPAPPASHPGPLRENPGAAVHQMGPRAPHPPAAAPAAPGPASAAGVAELRYKIKEFQAVADSLPPPPPKNVVCPGVYGRGCGGQLRWVCFGERSYGHWGCSNWSQCDYREYPPLRRSAPELSIQLDTPESIQVTAMLGAEEAVVHCGGVEKILRAAGVDLRLALPSLRTGDQGLPQGIDNESEQSRSQQPAVSASAAGSAGEGASGALRGGTKSVLGSPPRQLQQRMVHSVPTSPAGPWRQRGPCPAVPQRAVHSLPVSPAKGLGLESMHDAARLAAGVQARLTQYQRQQGGAAGSCADGNGAQLEGRISAEPSPVRQEPGAQAGSRGAGAKRHAGSVHFRLSDYERIRDVLTAFRTQAGIMLLPSLGAIPRGTLLAARGQLFNRPSPGEVEARYRSMPAFVEAALMPFQREGILFGLRCGGKCMLADEMGVGKTVQAIALMSCYREEWPLLIIVPASLRLVWAEELEKWLPQLRPSSIHVIEGKEGRVAPPKLPLVTITSFEMMQRLTCEGCKQRGQAKQGGCINSSSRQCAGPQHCMVAMGWKVIIVDESHQLRTSNRPPDAQHTEAVVSAVRRARRAVFLTGTPSLSRPYDLFRQVDALKPGLLGRDRFEFASAYCNRRAVPVPGGNGALRYDNSGLSRAAELHGLLRREVMLRRLKRDVLSQLPPKRRQVIRLPKPKPEHWPKKATGEGQGEEGKGGSDMEAEEYSEEAEPEGEDGPNVEHVRKKPAFMSEGHRTALAKLPSVIEWVMHALGAQKSSRGGRGTQRAVGDGSEEEDELVGGTSDSGPKLLLFAHHRDVMDGLAAALDGASGYSAVPFVRIDGATDGEGRRAAAARFRSDPSVRVALLSVTAAGIGLDFSCASVVVFAELPEDPSWVRQAEDRAHRKGQRLPVNVYFLCAKGTVDDRRWQYLSRSLAKVSAVMDGELSPLAGKAAEGGAPAARPQGGLVVDSVADAEAGAMSPAVPSALKCPQGPAREDCEGNVQQLEQGAPTASLGGLAAVTGPGLGGLKQMGANATEAIGVGTEAAISGSAEPPLGPLAAGPGARQAAGEAAKHVEVWFEVSGNTNRVHFHLSPDGTQPLRLSLPIETLTGPPDSPLLEELLEAMGPVAGPVAGQLVEAAGRPAQQQQQQGQFLPQKQVLQQQHQAQKEQVQQEGCDASMGGLGVLAHPAADGGWCIGLPAAQQEQAGPTAVPLAATATVTKGVLGACSSAITSPVKAAWPGPCLRPQQAPSAGAGTAPTCLPQTIAGAPQAAPAAAPQVAPAAAAQAAPPAAPVGANVVISGIGPIAVDPWLGRAMLQGMIAEAREFVAEWRELRAVHQSRLAGRILQAPLSQAVEAVQKEAAAAGALGVSTNRFVDSSRSDLVLPEGAQWRAVRVKFPRTANEAEYQQPFLPEGARLCINCAAAVPGAERVGEGDTLRGMQLLFCSGPCEARYALKCNGSAYRRALFKLERGVCVLCKLDCHDLVKRLQCIEKGTHRWEEKRQVLVAQLAPRFLAHGHKTQLERLVKNAMEGNAWHADHIRAVYEGGGLCDVDNLRTLCVLCHLDVTKRQAKERAAERAALKGDPSPKPLKRRAKYTRVFSDPDTNSPAAHLAVPHAGPATAMAAVAGAGGASRAAGGEKAAGARAGASAQPVPRLQRRPKLKAIFIDHEEEERTRGSAEAEVEAAAAPAEAAPAKRARGSAGRAAKAAASVDGEEIPKPPKRRPRLKAIFTNGEGEEEGAGGDAVAGAAAGQQDPPKRAAKARSGAAVAAAGLKAQREPLAAKVGGEEGVAPLAKKPAIGRAKQAVVVFDSPF